MSAVREMRHYHDTAVRGDGGSAPSLYDWTGGAEAFERLTTAFYREVVKDEVLKPLFAHMDTHHPTFVVMWLSEVFGGPDRYTHERGGYPHMLAAQVTEAPVPRWGWGVAPAHLPRG